MENHALKPYWAGLIVVLFDKKTGKWYMPVVTDLCCYPKDVKIPGGMSKLMETQEQTAIREYHEETGLVAVPPCKHLHSQLTPDGASEQHFLLGDSFQGNALVIGGEPRIMREEDGHEVQAELREIAYIAEHLYANHIPAFKKFMDMLRPDHDFFMANTSAYFALVKRERLLMPAAE